MTKKHGASVDEPPHKIAIGRFRVEALKLAALRTAALSIEGQIGSIESRIFELTDKGAHRTPQDTTNPLVDQYAKAKDKHRHLRDELETLTNKVIRQEVEVECARMFVFASVRGYLDI